MNRTLLAVAMITGFVLVSRLSYSEDLTTLDGKRFSNITELSKYPKQVFFTWNEERISVAITNLPDDFIKSHGYMSPQAMVALGDDFSKKREKEYSDFLSANQIDPKTGLPIDPKNGQPALPPPATNSVNYIKSMEWYEKAAALGDTNAMWKIVANDASGDYVAISPGTGLPLTKEQLRWLRKLAEKGDTDAIIELGQKQPAVAAQQTGLPVQSQSAVSDVTLSIRANAEKEWPDNYEMQEFAIKEQAEAYNYVATTSSATGVPQDVFENIKAKAASDWPDNYEMQKFQINQQVKAYTDLH
jgi:TPR repeat protein